MNWASAAAADCSAVAASVGEGALMLLHGAAVVL
jgi:hypothetical protein